MPVSCTLVLHMRSLDFTSSLGMVQLFWSLQVCLNTLRAGLIASRIDLTTELYPGVLAAPLIIGSIAGTGGRFSIDPILSGFGALEGGVLGYISAF